jgi:hypothetical protein
MFFSLKHLMAYAPALFILLLNNLELFANPPLAQKYQWKNRSGARTVVTLLPPLASQDAENQGVSRPHARNVGGASMHGSMS